MHGVHLRSAVLIHVKEHRKIVVVPILYSGESDEVDLSVTEECFDYVKGLYKVFLHHRMKSQQRPLPRDDMFITRPYEYVTFYTASCVILTVHKLTVTIN